MMQSTFHTTRPNTSRRLVQAISAWQQKARFSPSLHCRDETIFKTAAYVIMSTLPPLYAQSLAPRLFCTFPDTVVSEENMYGAN